MLNRSSIVTVLYLSIVSSFIALPGSISAQDLQPSTVDHNLALYACPAVVLIPGNTEPVHIGELVTNQPAPSMPTGLSKEELASGEYLPADSVGFANSPNSRPTSPVATQPPLMNTQYTPQQGLIMGSDWSNINISPASGGC